MISTHGHQGTAVKLPPEIAKALASDMRAFLVEKSALQRDEIAAHQAPRSP
jgi:hypothetical protein